MAAHSRPDVLLVDEVLAVGDEGFRRSCLERIAALRSQGTAVVLVSHDRALVELLADQAIYIQDGRLAAAGEPRGVLRSYSGGAG